MHGGSVVKEQHKHQAACMHVPGNIPAACSLSYFVDAVDCTKAGSATASFNDLVTAAQEKSRCFSRGSATASFRLGNSFLPQTTAELRVSHSFCSFEEDSCSESTDHSVIGIQTNLAS